MTDDDARTLHNPFISQGVFRRELAIQCPDHDPDVTLLQGPDVALTFPNQAWIDILPAARHLRSVFVDRPRAKDLSPVASLNLMNLTMSYSSHVKEWSFLRQLKQLKRLSLHNTLSLVDLEVASELRDLEIFELSGGYSKPLRLPSLLPLGRLVKLKAILMGAVRLANWSLVPIYELKDLRRFNCPTYWPKQEIAGLLRANPLVVSNASYAA